MVFGVFHRVEQLKMIDWFYKDRLAWGEDCFWKINSYGHNMED